MAKQIIIFVLLSLGWQLTAFSQEKPISITGISEDQSYGYSKANPVMAGSIPNSYTFLKMLQGPKGEPVAYEREGSCCQFKTKNSPFGTGLLDAYTVWYEGGQKVTLYINGYDYQKQQCPQGFTYKKE